ncbi:hypothetical protein evm_010206, partial [Chilo suppressalis]
MKLNLLEYFDGMGNKTKRFLGKRKRKNLENMAKARAKSTEIVFELNNPFLISIIKYFGAVSQYLRPQIIHYCCGRTNLNLFWKIDG